MTVSRVRGASQHARSAGGAAPRAAEPFDSYAVDGFHDEMFLPGGRPRPCCQALFDRVQCLSADELRRRQRAAERAMLRLGITFNVYGDQQGTERIIPFDILPRIIEEREWRWIERGLKQRITALNLFIDDVYHEQKIVKDRAIPEHVVRSAASFRQQCVGLNPPKGIWCHITGTDL
ncbi:MAG: circularly permuted type 2 ATP-grasp protein, partial [Gemmataceae bacterium]|nr:circularly permuted type 2 ATP-grasp protein [Gemmataceae bacterium]